MERERSSEFINLALEFAFRKKEKERSTETEKPFFLCVCVCVFELDLAAGDLIIGSQCLSLQCRSEMVRLGGGTLLHCPPGASPEFAGMPSAMPSGPCTEILFGALRHEIYT